MNLRVEDSDFLQLACFVFGSDPEEVSAETLAVFRNGLRARTSQWKGRFSESLELFSAEYCDLEVKRALAACDPNARLNTGAV